MKQVQLKRGKEDSLLRFHPWVFSGAIQHIDNDVTEGEVVRVITSNGSYIATGHFQQGSIAVRVLSFNDMEINDDFWRLRLNKALQARQPTIFPLAPTRCVNAIPTPPCLLRPTPKR